MIDQLKHGSLANSTAHLCVDMQNLFAEDTPWGVPWMDRVRPMAAKLARHRPDRTVFTRSSRRIVPRTRPALGAGISPDGGSLRASGSIRVFLSSYPNCRTRSAGVIIDKQVYSPFHDGRLAAYLRERGIDSLVVSGTETDVCVLAAVLAAVDHGFRS